MPNGQQLGEVDGTKGGKLSKKWQEMVWGWVWAGVAVAIALLILAVSIVRTTSAVSPISGQSQVTPTVALSPTPTPVDYYLPYPGILPDHVLYPVKMLRDWIRGAFTFDKLTKAKLYLLYADKRLNAAKFLVEGGKAKLGVSTASKAEKYLEKAYLEAKKAKGEETRDFWRVVYTASAKHKEVLTGLTERVGTDLRVEWQKTIDYAQLIYERTGQEMREGKESRLRRMS